VLSDLQACRADTGRLSELVLRACSQLLSRSSRKHEQQLASLKQQLAVQLVSAEKSTVSVIGALRLTDAVCCAEQKLKESDVEKQQGTVIAQMQEQHRRQLDQLTVR
jgi:hypothetical protein